MAVRKNSQEKQKKYRLEQKKRKRGRPQLAFHVKCYRFILDKIKEKQKKIKKNAKKIKAGFLILAKKTGIKQSPGRPKLAKTVKFKRFWQQRKNKNAKSRKQFLKKHQARWQKFLRFCGLKKRVGRPRKKKTRFSFFKKNYLTSLRKILFQKKEIAYFQTGLKKVKRWRINFSLFASIIFSLLFLLFSYGVYDFVFKDLPSATDLSTQQQNLTTRILDRNGQMLYRIYEDENRTLVPLKSVSEHLINATIAIEDKNFYQHFGFSPVGILRALFTNVTSDKVQGGSTITQQLVKSRLLSNERTLQRKLRELLLSLVVEGAYEKDEILEMYLNTVPYGGSTYGIEEASWRYFNKRAKDLSLAESALLAGLPQAPSTYSPYGPNPEIAKARQADVLRRMVEDGYISQEQADEARVEKLQFSEDVIDIKAPHFVMYVKKLLAEMYGEDLVAKGGLEVRTTLDLTLQEEVQKIVSEEINLLGNLHISNGAALVTNPKTGEILAMIGGVNYFDFAHDGQVNVTLRPRQPGSSIKPLTYALAFEQGKKPSDLIEDSSITYQIVGSRPYTPRNYDGKFRGKITLREALASSYNVPAVKLLAELGVQNLINEGRELGISTWTDPSRFGLSLTLGAGEVLMIDMVEVFSTFANLGYPVEANPFLEIRDAGGQTLYSNNCAISTTNCYTSLKLSPSVAYTISDILSDNQARASAFGLHSVLNIPNQEVAVKTGTTNSMKDNWTIGYTTDRLVATWVGNNDNTPMSYVASGITGASPIWNKIFLLLLDKQNPHRFAMPSNLKKVKICATTGTLPCSACPKVVEEIFVAGTEPLQACSDQYFIDLAAANEQKTIEAAQFQGGQIF
ncbi:MAG: PBP1A family penicillin-binding protein [Candidatus Pacebacteria bacterium]|nr:PBP1A family penicillin-binding protein [Candidatus Paceibacterota bacterium]